MRTVGKDEVGRGVLADVARDIAVVLSVVVLSCDGILVAVAGLDARGIRLLAHQGAHDHARSTVGINRTSLDITVAQHAVARQLTSKGAHTGNLFFRNELTVLNTEVFHDTTNIIE